MPRWSPGTEWGSRSKQGTNRAGDRVLGGDVLVFGSDLPCGQPHDDVCRRVVRCCRGRGVILPRS
jgi:hypothetical protein